MDRPLNHNLTGILLIIVSMAGFTFEDMFIKLLSGTIPIGQIMMSLGFGTMCVFGLITLIGGYSIFNPVAWGPVPLYRALSEAGAALTFYIALANTDLSVVAAIYQTIPLFLTVVASVFLGETVSIKRWLATLFGFAGVLLIIRPGFAGFDAYALIALLSVCFVVARDAFTRKLDNSIPSSIISFQGFAIIIPVGFMWMILHDQAFTSFSVLDLSYVIGGVIFGTIGYFCVVQGMRVGQTSVVAPFRYTRVIFAVVIGLIVFSEKLDPIMLLGTVIVILSGLFVYFLEMSKSKD